MTPHGVPTGGSPRTARPGRQRVRSVLVIILALALCGPAAAQVTLSWEVPAGTPGAKALVQGRYESAAAELRSALAGKVESSQQRMSWTLELSRALHGAGDHASADRLAIDLAEEAARANAPAVALKALLVAADVGQGKSFQQRLELVDAAASIVRNPGPANLEFRVQTELVRASIQTRSAPPRALEAMTRVRALDDSAPAVEGRSTAWMELIEARALSLNGKALEALPLAISARQRIQAMLGADHPLALYAGMQLALVHRRTGNYASARDLTSQLLGSARQVLASAHPWTLELLSMQFQEQMRVNSLPLARATATELIAAAEQRHGKDSLLHLDAQALVVDLLVQEGSYAQALQTMQPIATAIGRLAPGGPAHLNALHQLATVLSRNDQVAAALRIWQELLALELDTKGPGSEDVWATLNNIAAQYRAQRDFERALAEYARLESLMRPNVQRTHTGLVTVVNNIAETLVAMKRPAEARDRLKSLIDDLQADRKPADAQLLRARSNLASALSDLRETDAALAQHRSILQARRDALGADHPDTLNSLAQTAYALEGVGRLDEAADAFREVYRLRRHRLGPLHGDTITSARAAAGFLANPLGRLQEASELYGDAIRGVEVLRQGIGLPPAVRQRYFSDIAQMYKNQARILAKLGKWNEAFDVIELSKARTLVEQTRATSATWAARLSPGERDRLAEAERRVAQYTSTLALSTAAPAAGQINPTEQERDRALDQLRLLREELGRKYGWAGPREDATAARTTRASSDLEADDVFVSFSLLGDALMAVRLKPDGTVRGGVLEPTRGLADSIAALGQIASVRGGLDQVQVGSANRPPRILWRVPNGGFRLLTVDQPAPDGASVAASFDEVVEFVSAALLRAMPTDVWSSRRLLISLDEQLSTAPLDLLLREGRRWGQTHEVTIAQSWTMHVLLKERERAYAELRREPILVFGNPAYAGGPGRGGGSAAFERREAAAPSTPFGRLTWFTLSGAGREVAALSGIYQLTSGTTLFEGTSATEANLMALATSGSLARFRIIHFATHGYLHPRNALLSSVVLAEAGVGEGRAAGVDGYVTAADWLGLRMRSDLTVVAACDSGAGDPVSGEGMVGLPFGLFAAGNRSTLLTLWSVYDEATAEFIRRFHAHVGTGLRFSTALALTKREFMAGDAGADWRAPAFWAPFVLYGT